MENDIISTLYRFFMPQTPKAYFAWASFYLLPLLILSIIHIIDGFILWRITLLMAIVFFNYFVCGLRALKQKKSKKECK